MPDQSFAPPVSLRFGMNDQPQATAYWVAMRSERGLRIVRSKSWPCQVEDPLASGKMAPAVADEFSDSNYALLYEVADALVFVRLGFGSASVAAAAKSPEETDAAIQTIEKCLPRQEVKDDGFIPVTFWSYTPHGPQSNNRDVMVPKWDEIRGFYNPMERDGLDQMMSENFVPGLGGQLILWRGIPGTGKTTCLRALGHAWRDWAELHVIADPEKFFGDHADYMLNVMLGAGPQGNGDEGKWRILVLEDAGELLVKDSKQKVGQALSRFLNAVDGLIGQGLRFLVLVTTNEDDMGQLNEAVGRHGRAAVNIEFKALEPELARDVLTELRQRAGKEDSVGIVRALTKGNHLPLADIFALAEGRTREEQKPTVGFAV